MKIPIWLRNGVLTAALMGVSVSASALTIGTIDIISASSAPDATQFLGNKEVATVNVPWVRTDSSATHFTVNIAAPIALESADDCTFDASVLTCSVPAGGVSTEGSHSFKIKGAAATGSFNLTATPQSGSTAARNITLRAAGKLTVEKQLTSPEGRDPIPGEDIIFKIKPVLTEADDLPSGARIELVDTLPGANNDDFQLTGNGGCTTSGRTVTCTITGPKSVAEINSTEFILVGQAKKSGSDLTNAVNVRVAEGSEYVDLTLDDNNDTVEFSTGTGGDPQAKGTYTSDPTPVGSTQQLTLRYYNNGPTTIPVGGTIKTTIPAGFGINTLPAGCVSDPVHTETASAREVSCTTSNTIAPTAAQDFPLSLIMPNAAASGTFPIEVTPPSGFADSNIPNNTTSLPWTVSPPYSDLRLTKSKTGGPKFKGDEITSTFTISNRAPATQSQLTYDANNPLRVVDWLNPLEIADGTIVSQSEGWYCQSTTGQTVPAGFPTANTTRVECYTTGKGSLASNGGSITMSFTTKLGDVPMHGTPVLLSNHACVGKTAETQLATPEENKLLVGDLGNAHNCQTSKGSGEGLYLTDVDDVPVNITKQVRIGESEAWANSATLPNNQDTIQWLVTIQNTDGAKTIPTLKLTENIPARMRHNAGSNRSTATTVTTQVSAGSATGSCPSPLEWDDGALDCSFTNVAPNTTILVTITMKRPLASGDHVNTATLSSKDSTLTGTVTDSAEVEVAPRFDPAVTSKTVTGYTAGDPYKRIGEVVEFKITVANHGQDVLSSGDFTLIDEFNTDASKDEVAYKVLSATMPNANCTIDESVAGVAKVACTSTSTLNQGNTREATIKTRLLKPTAAMPNPANSELFGGAEQTNTARVVLNNGKCEWRELTEISTSCNDDNSKSNNQQSAVFKVKVPDFDLIVDNELLTSSPVEIGDSLRYRFTMRNDGPSRAENVVLVNHLEIPDGYSLALSSAGVENINSGSAPSGYSFKAGASVTCTQTDDNVNDRHYVTCVLSDAGADMGLNAGEMVNFELVYDMTPPDPANKVVSFHNAALICANELVGHEKEGGCGDDRFDYDSSRTDNGTTYANNLASNNVPVFPVTDLAINKVTITDHAVVLGEPVEYKLTIWNNGTALAERIRITDTLPAGFAWLNSGVHQPFVTVPAGSDALVTGGELNGNKLGVLAATPAIVLDDSTQNVCYLTDTSPDPVTATAQQTLVCDLEGQFPATHPVELTLFATPVIGIYEGPYNTDVQNDVVIAPGKTDGYQGGVDGNGDPIFKNRDASTDKDSTNNASNSQVQVVKSSISGYVYHDSNNDGDRSGETPIAGVTITLAGTDVHNNAVNLTATTNGSGFYKFDNLVPGTYTVTETHPADWVDGKDTVGDFEDSAGQTIATPGSGTAGNDVISNIVLPAGTHGVEYNFGELKQFADPSALPASISGYVYHDANNNGKKDGGEAGISNVTIKLSGSNGHNLETTTDANGYYRFDGLEPGATYTVTEEQPAGWDDGKESVGTKHNGSATKNDVFTVTPVSGEHGENWNFGELYIPPPPTHASLAGMVYHDRNDNGLPESGEEGIAGVTIRLLNSSGTEVATTTTDANGRYRFSNLLPGTYRVIEEQPAGWKDGKERIGSHGGSTPGNDIFEVKLAAGDDAVNYDFGELLPLESSIAGCVYHDKNNNGIREEGEEGIPGVSIVLTDAEGNVRTEITGADGCYEFDSLTPGMTYVVTEEQPEDWIDGKDTAGTVFTDESEGTNDKFVVTPGEDEHGKNWNFGELLQLESSIAGCVYHDKNNNGIREDDEEGIPGVNIVLTDEEGNVRTEITGADGCYEFDSLTPGMTYVVTEEQPEGWTDGKDTAGTVFTDESEGANDKFVVTPGEDEHGKNWNFGELKPEDLEAALKIVKTLYEGHDAGASCAGVKELLIIDKHRVPKPITWCFEITNTGDLALNDPRFDDEPLFTESPGMAQTPMTLRADGSLPLQPGDSVVYYVEEMRENSLVNEVAVNMQPVDKDEKPIPDKPRVEAEDGAKTLFGYLYDPPFGEKTGEQVGQSKVVRWTMVWVNDNPVAANNAVVSDGVPVGMTWHGDLKCSPEGLTTVNSCEYQAPSAAFPRGRVVVSANFAPDFGKTIATAEHSLKISFDVLVDNPQEGGEFFNQGEIEWDPAGPGGDGPLQGLTDDPVNPGSSPDNPEPSPIEIKPGTPDCLPGEPGCDGQVVPPQPPPNPVAVPVNNPLALLVLILGMGWIARRFHVRKQV